jgi:hypothetical protein
MEFVNNVIGALGTALVAIEERVRPFGEDPVTIIWFLSGVLIVVLWYVLWAEAAHNDEIARLKETIDNLSEQLVDAQYQDTSDDDFADDDALAVIAAMQKHALDTIVRIQTQAIEKMESAHDASLEHIHGILEHVVQHEE